MFHFCWLLRLLQLYIFFFSLKYSHNSLLTVNKYKNLISYYLWLSFFTLIFIVINLIQWIFLFGTLNFTELGYFLSENQLTIFIFLAFFWKFGVSGFHFFKLELYKYLESFPLLIFSTVSLVVNTFLLIYLLYILSTILNYSVSLLIFVMLFNIVILLQGLDKVYFFYFFAISSINTWVFFFIIGVA